MKENRAKIDRYKKLLDSLVKQLGYFPTTGMANDYRAPQKATRERM